MSILIPNIWLIAPIAAIIALFVARIFYVKLLAESEGTEKMQEIAGHVKVGAMAYLKSQYKVVGIAFIIVFVILTLLAINGIQYPFVPIVFLSGGIWSAICGYLGMKTATNASARTAAACQSSLNKGLQISFRGGAIMGLMVVGFGLLDISLWFFILNALYDANILNASAAILQKMGVDQWDTSVVNSIQFQKLKLNEVTTTLLTYAMGASFMALFARVGGGIFTKAADVGADLVGKVEAGIPEDDPRNPATIADNVGDNVGDVAGMGADLFESYCGSILAAASLGASLVLTQNADPTTIIMPMVVAGGGILFSLLGIFLVRTKENADQSSLLKSLLIGTGISSLCIILFLLALVQLSLIEWGVFYAVVVGLVSGIIIGQATEYYTAPGFKPTQKIVIESDGGAATNILSGISNGMMSTLIPVITIICGIMIAFSSAGGYESITKGIYGIAFAAIGMLSTLGIQLATDAFGPIADNAGGNAEMAGLPPEVRERTDTLDALGNTTAATGKGFAIGSAALTALALIAAYLDTIKEWLARLVENGAVEINNVTFIKETIGTTDIPALVDIFQINIINPKFLGGLFIGAMVAFVFCALTISAVGKAAGEMVEEVRRQFREIKGIMTGEGTPDYAKCVEISTTGALQAMIVPSLLAILTPIIVGLLLGIAGVMGLLSGTLTTGFSLAMFLNNAGGSWDNAKKLIETGEQGGKGSEAHKASVIGDTVGDPFKDTSGPSLNILIKLMTIVSIVFAGLILKYGLH